MDPNVTRIVTSSLGGGGYQPLPSAIIPHCFVTAIWRCVTRQLTFHQTKCQNHDLTKVTQVYKLGVMSGRIWPNYDVYSINVNCLLLDFRCSECDPRASVRLEYQNSGLADTIKGPGLLRNEAVAINSFISSLSNIFLLPNRHFWFICVVDTSRDLASIWAKSRQCSLDSVWAK